MAVAQVRPHPTGALRQKNAARPKESLVRHFWGFIDALQSRWNPTLAAEKAQARQQELQNFYRRMAKERADYKVLLDQNKQLAIENLITGQKLQIEEMKNRAAEDHDRHIREYHEAKRVFAELEQERIKEDELEHNDSLRDGPPPPKLGK